MSCRNAGPGIQSDCAATENVASGLRMRNPANSSGCETRWSCLKAWQEPAQYFLKHSITRQVHRMATLRARAHLDHRGCPSPTLCNETRKSAQLRKFAKLATQKLIVMTKKHRISIPNEKYKNPEEVEKPGAQRLQASRKQMALPERL